MTEKRKRNSSMKKDSVRKGDVMQNWVRKGESRNSTYYILGRAL